MTDAVRDRLESVSLEQISIQTRFSQHFRLPSTLDTPLIMIGPGTGVAPFIGFLEHLYVAPNDGSHRFRCTRLHCRHLSSKSIEGFDVDKLNTWLFYGCRHRQHDFLFEYDSFVECFLVICVTRMLLENRFVFTNKCEF